MRIEAHILSGVPFLLAGYPLVALGCLLPDLTWVANEVTIQRSGKDPLDVIDELPEWRIVPYRIVHSFFTLLAVAYFSPALAIGMAIHVALDLPTHGGRMRQIPFYPIPWRWPWVASSYS